MSFCKNRKLGLLLVLLMLICTRAEAGNIQSAIDAYLQHYTKNQAFSGVVLVARGDSVLFQRAYGKSNFTYDINSTTETRYKIASLTKSMTATIALRLAEEGKINLGAKICDYLPDYPAKTGKKITIYQLLTHTSGIPHYGALSGFFEKAAKLGYSHKDFIKLFWNEPLLFEPGTKVYYSSFGYYLLGVILEQVSSSSFPELVHKYIFTPAEMKNSGVDNNYNIVKNLAAGYDYDYSGVVNASYRDMSTALATGDVYSTAHDLFKYYRALDKGKLLSKKSLETMYKVVNWSAACGWFVSSWQNPVYVRENLKYYYHIGGTNGFRSYVANFPSEDLLIIMLSNYEFADRDRIGSDLISLAKGIPVPERQFKKSVRVDEKNFYRLEGIYHSSDGKSMTIGNAGKGIYLIESGNTMKLFPTSKETYFTLPTENEVVFFENKKNSTMEMSLFKSGKSVFTGSKKLNGK